MKKFFTPRRAFILLSKMSKSKIFFLNQKLGRDLENFFFPHNVEVSKTYLLKLCSQKGTVFSGMSDEKYPQQFYATPTSIYFWTNKDEK